MSLHDQAGTVTSLGSEPGRLPAARAVRELAAAPRAGLVSAGYEGRDIDTFVERLVDASVSIVADVRLTPLSRKPGFSKTRLHDRLRQAGIGYRHLRHLGNPKDNRPPFWEGRVEEGQETFRRLLAVPAAEAQLRELAEYASQQRVVVLCFEADVHRCHRSVILEVASRRAALPVLSLF